jgi:outer membrane protein assembly factor BamB
MYCHYAMDEVSESSKLNGDNEASSTSVRSTRRGILRSSALLTALSVGTTGSVTGDIGITPADVTDADWTMWRFNRANTGYNPQINQIDALEAAWGEPYIPADPAGNLYSPSVADGTVYYGMFDQQMHAIDANTGEEQWTAGVGDIIQSSPTILDGTVYSGSHDGNIYAWDADTGDEKWSITGGGAGERHTSVTVSQDQNTIYIGSDRLVFSLEPETGAVNWTFESPNHFISSPTLSGGRVYIGAGAPEDDGDGYVHALDDQGDQVEELWRREFPDANVRSTAAVSGGTVFVGTLSGSSINPAQETLTSDSIDTRVDTYGVTAETAASDLTGSVWALDADTGEVNWTYGNGGVFSSPAVAENTVFIGVRNVESETSRVVALDQDSGDQVWAFEFNGYVTASPAYAAGQVYIGGSDGRLYVVDAATGEQITRTQLSGNVYSPAVTDDGVYVANSSSQIFALTTETTDRGVTGTITDQNGNPIEGVEVGLFTRTDLFKPLGFISDSITGNPTLPEPVVSAVTAADGSYEILNADPGAYVAVAVPPDGADVSPSLMRTVASPIVIGDGVETRDVTLDGRPLRELEPVFEDAFDLVGDPRERQAETLIDRHTARSAEISVAGTTEFDAVSNGVTRVSDTISLLDLGLTFDGATDADTVHQELEREAVGRSIEVNYNGLMRVIRDIFETLDIDQQEALATITTAIVNQSWLEDQIYGAGEAAVEEFLETTEFYQDPADAIAENEDRFAELTTTEPAEEFDLNVVEERVEYFIDQFRGKGIPGAVITPTGNIYHYEQTEAQARSFENTQSAIDAIQTTEKVAQVTQVVGKALMATGKGAPIGALLWGAGKKVDTATDVAEPLARLKLALDWGLTLVHWGIDLQDIESLNQELIDWLEVVVEEGITPVAPDDIVIESIDLGLVESPIRTNYVTANTPDDPDFGSSIPGIGDSLRAEKIAIVELRNTSSEPVSVRIGMYDIRSDAETYSDSAALSPPPEDEPYELDPGESHQFFPTYRTAPFNPVDNHQMITNVFVDGQILTGSEPQTFNVLLQPPSLGSSTTPEREYYALTQASKGHNEVLTQEEEEELEPTSKTILNTELTPETSTSETTVTTASDTNNVLVSHVTDGIAALRVFDEQGRSVGYDAERDEIINQIPEATYTGPNSNPELVSLPEGPDRTLTVEVNSYRFVTDESTTTSVQLTEIPEREALLSVSPGVISTIGAPGEITTVELELSEVGRQVGINNGAISSAVFENSVGTPLPEGVTVELSQTEFSLAPDSSEAVQVEFRADASVAIPADEPTRFEGNILIETENAGSVEATLSLLLLNTDRNDLRLTVSADGVTKLTVLDADPTVFELEERPPGMTPTDAVSVSGRGEGEARFITTEYQLNSGLEAYIQAEDGWQQVPLESRESQLEVVIEDTAQVPNDEPGASLLIGETDSDVYLRQIANKKDIVDTASLRTAVADWREGTISRAWLETVAARWESENKVP